MHLICIDLAEVEVVVIRYPPHSSPQGGGREGFQTHPPHLGCIRLLHDCFVGRNAQTLIFRGQERDQLAFLPLLLLRVHELERVGIRCARVPGQFSDLLEFVPRGQQLEWLRLFPVPV